MIIIFKGYLLHSKNIRIYAVSLTFIYWCTFRITLWVDTLLAAIPLGIRRESLSWTFNGLWNVSFALLNLDVLYKKIVFVEEWIVFTKENNILITEQNRNKFIPRTRSLSITITNSFPKISHDIYAKTVTATTQEYISTKNIISLPSKIFGPPDFSPLDRMILTLVKLSLFFNSFYYG